MISIRSNKQKLKQFKLCFISLIISWCVLASSAYSIRVKDITTIKGVRYNQLVGYGLVVGLDGTGDGKKSKFTIQSMARMLEKMGMAVDPDDINVNNVAAVMITADLPPFARIGSKIDVLVSSIGNANNLQGGTLLFTPLKAANGGVYAVAQGPVSTGGFSQGGAGGSVQKNFPTVGRVINGALIEEEITYDFAKKDQFTLTLNNSDFTTACRLVRAINTALYDNIAKSPDAGTVAVKIPERYKGNIVEFVSIIEGLHIKPDMFSRIVINERTGTVVMGENVRISTIAISHGNLSIEIKETANVSQPAPMSGGSTVVIPESEISVVEGNNALYLMESGVSIGAVVRALNALGVSSRDLMSIFQAIKVAGALQAKLETM